MSDLCHLFSVPVTLLWAPEPPHKKNPAGLLPVEDPTGPQSIVVDEGPVLSAGENVEHSGSPGCSANGVSSEALVLCLLLSITIIILFLGNPLAQSHAENAGAGSVGPLTVLAGDTIDCPDFSIITDWCIYCICFIGCELIQVRASFVCIC